MAARGVKPRSQGLSSFLPIKRESLEMRTSFQHGGFDCQSFCDRTDWKFVVGKFEG